MTLHGASVVEDRDGRSPFYSTTGYVQEKGLVVAFGSVRADEVFGVGIVQPRRADVFAESILVCFWGSVLYGNTKRENESEAQADGRQEIRSTDRQGQERCVS